MCAISFWDVVKPHHNTVKYVTKLSQPSTNFKGISMAHTFKKANPLSVTNVGMLQLIPFSTTYIWPHTKRNENLSVRTRAARRHSSILSF
jgi:hypothetical protein